MAWLQAAWKALHHDAPPAAVMACVWGEGDVAWRGVVWHGVVWCEGSPPASLHPPSLPCLVHPTPSPRTNHCPTVPALCVHPLCAGRTTP